MEIRNAKLRNVNTIRWESRNNQQFIFTTLKMCYVIMILLIDLGLSVFLSISISINRILIYFKRFYIMEWIHFHVVHIFVGFVDWVHFLGIHIFVGFVEDPILTFYNSSNSDYLFALWRKILWPRISNLTNVCVLLNPRKLVSTKMKPSTGLLFTINWCKLMYV